MSDRSLVGYAYSVTDIIPKGDVIVSGCYCMGLYIYIYICIHALHEK